MSKKKRLSKPRPPVKKRPSPSHASNDELVRQAAAQILAKDRFAGDKTKVLYGVGENMSEALETLIEPFMSLTENLIPLKLLVMLGIVAWNTTITGPEIRESLMASMRATLRQQEGEQIVGAEILDLMIDAMIERKKELYPHNQRLMLDFKLTEVGGGFHISVASTPSPEMGLGE